MFQRASTQRNSRANQQLPTQTVKSLITDENVTGNTGKLAIATAAAHEHPTLKSKQTALNASNNAAAAVKSFTSGNTAVLTRKRRALGDVSNQQLAANISEVQQNAKALKPIVKPASRIAQAVNLKKPLLTATTAVRETQQQQQQQQQPQTTTTILTRAARRKSLQMLEAAKAQPAPSKPSAVEVIVKQNQHQQEQDENKRSKINSGDVGSAAVAAPRHDDLDADDICDPVMVSEYVVEIFQYLRQLEVKTMADPKYMSKQKELQWKMRGILIDWLVDVHGRFRLLPETLFLTINLIDRFLSIRNVSVTKLQLVGITAMFIAAKYEEVYAPSINQFVYIADGGYSNEELIKAERYMLAMLDFNLQYPNPLNFLRRCSKADGYDLQTRNFSKYLMEATMLDENFLHFTPSMIAATSMYFSRLVLSRGEWDANLEYYSGYSAEEMKGCFKLMFKSLCRERKLQAIYIKYSSSRYHNASVYFDQFVKQRQQEFGVNTVE